MVEHFVVIANMHAKSNRKDKNKVKRIRQILGKRGEVIETYKPSDLEKAIDYVIKYKPDITLPDGGDGMQLLFYTNFIKKWPKTEQMPPMAVSASGTWNVLAKHVGMKSNQWQKYLEYIVNTKKEDLTTQDVGLIKIEDDKGKTTYGFSYGMGLPVTILNEYYTAKDLKMIKLGMMLGEFGVSAFFKYINVPLISSVASKFLSEKISYGKFFDKFAQKREYKLTYENGESENANLLGLMAQTLPSLGLPKCNIFYKATNTKKFHVLGTKHDILEALILSPALYTGNMHLVSPEALIDKQTNYFKIESEQPFDYQVNGDTDFLGDQFKANKVELSYGRRIFLVKYLGYI
ncbi:hypothetical protein D6777_03435 [Candidatus Woesearchaeota archaeon]|nr:MAG: hypothetical protein D6777_03435 [Candidatus Woesearchaeota archaeon]